MVRGRKKALRRLLSQLRQKALALGKLLRCMGVPRSTLHDHVSGRVEMYRKPGPSPYLSSKEEMTSKLFNKVCEHGFSTYKTASYWHCSKYIRCQRSRCDCYKWVVRKVQKSTSLFVFKNCCPSFLCSSNGTRPYCDCIILRFTRRHSCK